MALMQEPINPGETALTCKECCGEACEAASGTQEPQSRRPHLPRTAQPPHTGLSKLASKHTLHELLVSCQASSSAGYTSAKCRVHFCQMQDAAEARRVLS
jgi:hypothetical protein